MANLSLYKIEAVVVDDRLTRAEVEKRLNSFIISLSVKEIEIEGTSGDPVASSSTAPIKKAAKPRKRQKRNDRGVVRNQTAERLVLIKKAIGTRSLTLKQIVAKTNLEEGKVISALDAALKTKQIAVEKRANKGTRAVRYFSVIG